MLTAKPLMFLVLQEVVSNIRRYDWPLMGAVFLLVSLGLITLFSLTGVSTFPFLGRQLIWSLIGIAALGLASFIDFRLFRTLGLIVLLFYLFSVFLLITVLAGNFTIRGTAAWIQIGDILIQPVELTKLAVIILLAKFFSKRHIEIYRVRHILVSGLYVVIPAGLVLLQPDLGSAAVLITIWVFMVIFSGMKLRHFFFLLALAGLFSWIAWAFILAPYQKARITSFVDPYIESQGAGYQMIQSMIAVGSGQLWGKGLGYGSQTHLHFLPEAETDFIFAAFAEEWGLVGVAVMLALIFIVLWRIVYIGMRASDNFSRLYTLGFAVLIFVQSFIHIGMNMGVLPVTGLTLPFVSYGGSSLVTLLAGVGIVQNIKINSRREIE